MSDEDPEFESEEDIRAALRAIREGDEPGLRDVLLLVNASYERRLDLVPRAVIEAVEGKWETDRDFANGGADQFAWNHGAEVTRLVATRFRAVGALENADLLDRLAGELDAYQAEVGETTSADDVVARFMGYRKRVKGPFFGIPEPGEELAEALLEYVIAHREEVVAPDAALPPPETPQ